jgi:predicted nucleic acid-binding protein
LKAERARQLLLHDNWGWSAQVAGEFYYVATSPKRQFRLSHSLAQQYVETWLGFPTASISISIVRDALELSAKFQISYWDAAIVAAARELACQTVYSEDLSDRQSYDGVIVINPFSEAVDTEG